MIPSSRTATTSPTGGAGAAATTDGDYARLSWALGGSRGRDRHAVAAVRLGAVERGVGAVEDVVPHERGAARRRGDADRDGEVEADDRVGGDGRAQLLGRRARRGGRAAEQQDDELLAAEPVDEVIGPQLLAQPVGDLAQDGVAGRVAAGVVDELEAVEVEQDHGDGLAGQARLELDLRRCG